MNAVITLAPAVVLTVVSLPLLVVVDSALAAAIVLTGLVANAAGIGSDLADVLALREYPPGTLLYSKDAQFVYEPAAGRWLVFSRVRDRSGVRVSLFGKEAPSTGECPLISA